MFRDRVQAGRRLASALEPYKEQHPVILGLPRGGVPVAAEVADQLGAPLDVLVVRKLGVPWQPELGFGAVGENGVSVLNQEMIDEEGLLERDVAEIAAREADEVARRVHLFRGERSRIPVDGETVIIVDDGVATGFTARAAIEIVKRLGAKKIVFAVPVGPADTIEDLRRVAGTVVCLEIPGFFLSIGQNYADFTQVVDEEVSRILAAFPNPSAVPHAVPG